MEYTSSEDDELIEDYVDLEEDIMTSDVEQQAGEVAASLHFFNHQDNSLSLVHTIGNELIVSEADVKSQDPHLGMEFESDTVARLFYNAYALRLGFGIRVARSRSERRKGIEVLVMKRFVCLKEGHHKKKVTELANKKKRKRLSIRDGCPAMMEVVRRGADRWVITKLVLEHTHVVVSPDKRWTKKAKSGIVLDERDVETQSYCQESPTLRYHDIFHDALKVAEKGAASIETYKFAKEVLLKAFSELVGLEEEVLRHGYRDALNI
ncbi:hypothetical protein M5K25_015750 [Dendrobium thyrsiflorum]|uniref:FAR1 domain-containing protein n=1 Tax=Dendrobium thyrsiflorum TaxID=117978 RepID=A0ABD0URY4_DENTH